jgi:hypothetical protein
MKKNIQIELRLDSYRDFFDRDWFAKWTEETRNTALYQPVFDLGLAWRYTANTHVLPWLLATNVQGATEMNVNTTEPFGRNYVSGVHGRLAKRMGSSLRKAQRHRMQKELDAIYDEVEAISVVPQKFAPDAMWQNMVQNSEFQFALIGSQRLCYGAIYYAYEDFLTRCVGLAKGKTDYRWFKRKDFERDITSQFGGTVFDECWNDARIQLARVTRNAIVHSGGRVTDEFTAAVTAAKYPFVVEDGEIQIMAPDTTNLFHLLKDMATRVIAAALQHPNIK